MVLRSLLCGCFGGQRKGNQEVSTIEGASLEVSPITSKSPEIVVKSQQSFASSRSSTTTVSATPLTKALCVVSKGTYKIVTDIPYPSMESCDEIIIQTKAIGLNPIDWKSVEHNFCMPSFPWINGREMAGIVVQVGSNVKAFKVGDSVWASTYYRDRRAGTFQEYVVCPQHTVLPLPCNISLESGACLGVAGLTAAMTLWRWLRVPMPLDGVFHLSSPKSYILVWGGSTVTGQFAIQFAIQSGLEVITVTSAKTKQLAERLGAKYVITRDGKSNTEIVSEVRAIAGDELTLAIDVVGNDTAACCMKALSINKPGILAPLAFLRDGESVPANVTVANIEMKRFVIEDGNRIYAETMNRLIQEGKLIFPEAEILNGGLEQVEGGLRRLKRGDMGGKKLIVTI